MANNIDVETLRAECRQERVQFEQHSLDTYGPVPAPPAWARSGTRPLFESLTYDGAPLALWVRNVGTYVDIVAEDTIENGRWVRSPAAIRFFEPAGGPDVAAARRLATELVNAAFLLDG
jgi:hypothetical protein